VRANLVHRLAAFIVCHVKRPRLLSSPRTALVLLLLINLMNYVDRQILSATEESIGREFGRSAAETGALATYFLIAYMLCAPVFGYLADRTRRWWIIAGGVLVWTLASGGSGAVPTFGLLMVMRILIGVGEAAYGPVAPTVISDLYPVADRGRVLAWFYAAIPVGSALGYVVGGMFNAHWHWAFFATVPPGLLLVVWAVFMPEPKRGTPSPGTPGEGWGEGELVERAIATDVSEMSPHPNPLPEYRERGQERRERGPNPYLQLLRIPSYILDTIGMTLMTFAIGGIAFFMPRYLTESRHLDPEHSKMAFGAIIATSGLLATIAGGIAGDKLKPRLPGSYFLVSAAGMICGFPLFLLMLVTPFPLCWVVIFLACFCLFFNTGPSNTILANVTPPKIRASAFAFNILIIHLLGDAVSPPIVGWVRDRWNLETGFAVVSVMMFLGGLVWLFGARYLAADTARVEAGAV